MSLKNKRNNKRSFHITPTTMSEAIIKGLAMQRAKQIVAQQDTRAQEQPAEPKMPQKI